MIRNYLKTAIRNLRRNKAYALINVLGLTVGIAACLLIFLVIRFETSFDKFHAKRDAIYRVGSQFNSEDGAGHSAGIVFPAGPAIRIDFPQIKEVASIFGSTGNQVTVEAVGNEAPKKFTETIYFAEPEFFTMFDFGWITGDAKGALTEPGSAAITKSHAVKYFGNWKTAIGKTIMRNNNPEQVYKINAILEDPPVNTDFPLTIVISYASLKNTNTRRNLQDWVSTFSQHYTFVVLPASYSVDKFNKDLETFARKHKPAEYLKDKFIAHSLVSIHYDERFGNFRGHTFSRSLITALVLIGIFLVIIACVNFINLATAQAVNRSKEVGVRKVLGGNRRQLAFQFLSETGLITFAALFAAALVAWGVLPFLNKLLEVKMSFDLFQEPQVLLFLLATGIVVTFFSGLYPALVVSGFNPISALKNKFSPRIVGGISLRRVLVVLQFSIAHILIIGTLIVVSQMDYFKKATLGFDKASIINVPLPGDSVSKTKVDALRNQLLQNPDIKSTSFSFATPSADGNWQSDFKFDHSDKNTNWSANLKWADIDYFKTYGLQFVAGRSYNAADTVTEIVVNETFARKLGITDPEEIIGKQVDFWEGETVASIVGVVRDFNSYSLREPMAPVVLGTWKRVYQTIGIKIAAGKERSTLAFIENLWTKTFPDNVYEYKFLDETINNFYKQENQLSMLYKIFAG
ncbi:MAG: ABC transporter permease, partial [Chitinophagaceae bacterium]|nr:ABC transporter permease [Chitinophagaceae bacterium]